LGENKTKNILVTGGAGFIGSHLCKTLLKLGHNVICLDNLFTGSINNISEIIDEPNFEFVKHDIVEPYYRDNVDEIYNLACPASPIHYQRNPIKTVKTCTIGVINMLGLAKKNNAKILQASTSEIYGNPEEHPQSELYNGNVNPVGYRSCYDEGKRCSETLFMDYNREHKLKIKIVRIFNTYGPNMSYNDGRVVSNFITQAIENNEITIYGDGDQTRSFQYVDDLIEAMIKFMGTFDDFIGPLNIGNPEEISIKDLAKIILELTHSESKIIHKNLPKDDPLMRKQNISLAKNKLDWIPKVKLKDGLLKTIKYFKEINLAKQYKE
jgi:UDP-glucuronate decarboxylase